MNEIERLSADIFEELCGIPTVDAHEHLPPEKDHLAEAHDFYSLFEHYCQADLVAAGATPAELAMFANRDLPLEERWVKFKPFFSAIRTGSYARAALWVVRDLLDLPDLNDETYAEAGVRLQALQKPGLYDAILRERCNLAACIDCWYLDRSPYPDYFFHLAGGHDVVNLMSRETLDQLAEKCDRTIHRLDDALACMTQIVESWRANPQVVGIKSIHAYERSIAFQKVTHHEAELVFNQILTHPDHTLSLTEAQPLQDYLMFELAARAEAVGLPMVFHTGLQAGNGNRIAHANPLLLQPLLEEFPRVRFDLFHGGMPWVREIAVLAKYFPGVHLNMAWMHIISPAQSRAALAEWLDMVPNTKIFGFGGDYLIVEKVYGHLKMARQNIARVLAEKVQEGSFSRAEASLVARRLMFDNPNEFYRLGLDK